MNNNIKILPNGIWVLKNDTHISRWTEEHNSLNSDPWLFKWLTPLLKDCKIAFDIGAFIGDHTWPYLNMGMSVYAFEPNPDAFECLEKNCSNAICHNLAASDEDGELNFLRNDNAGASHLCATQSVEDSLKIKTIKLDDFFNSTIIPDYIKIDTEGFEPKVLIGMSQILINNKPKLFIEFNKGALERNGYTYDDLKKQIESYGYNNFLIYPPTANYSDEQYDLFCFYL